LSIKEPLVAFQSICAGNPPKKKKKKKEKKRELWLLFFGEISRIKQTSGQFKKPKKNQSIS
jgi:hypothetical protein